MKKKNILPKRIRGDSPCADCGTEDNPIWSIESVFWNEVVRKNNIGKKWSEILCINCFIKRVDKAGFVCGWRLLPDWKWNEKPHKNSNKSKTT